jgi:hypothetical protein
MTGEWTQAELFGEYQSICALSGFEPTPLKHFGDELVEAGCECWRADTSKDGKRHRPEMVFVPPSNEK